MRSISNPMRRLSQTLILVVCTGTLALAGCSKSSSHPPALGTAADLQGFWKVWVTETGQGEVGPAALLLMVSGSTISGVDLSGTVDGSEFQFVASVFNGETSVKGTLTTVITGSGSYEVSKTTGPTVTGTFRMMKFTPTGSFSVTGSILGETVTHTSNTAIGTRKYADPAHTALTEVEVMTGGPGLDFELDFEPANLTLGSQTIGTAATEVAVAVEFSTGTISARPIAIGGTVEVTKYDDSGFTATFTMRLDTGDTLTGNIDVRFDIEALHPSGP